MALVEFQNVTRVYKTGDHELKALDGASFTLDEGKFVVILGPSGAGKSTLLNMLGGLDSPTNGKIVVGGKDISTLTNNELADYRASTVGFVFQFYNLIPTLTVKENVALVKEIAPGALSAEQMLAEVGLSDHLNNFPSELSGGMMRRVAIARALAYKSKVLILDEALRGLDEKNFENAVDVIERYRDGRTLISVTHVVSRIEENADKFINLDKISENQ